MDVTERRVRQLLSAVLDETCSDADRQELCDLLELRPELAAGLADDALVHGLLLWQSEDISECIDLELAAAGRQLAQADAKVRPLRRAARLGTWALAASLLLGAGIVLWQGIERRRVADVALADAALAGDDALGEVVEQEGVFWSNSSTALQKGRLIYPGSLQSNAGAYTIQFRSGPLMHVYGGSELRIESDMLVHLDQGRATAHVPESGIGFTIKTPIVNVIDQGTQFGVAVGEGGKTDVIVFDGRVDLQEDGPAPPKQLIRGEGVSINAQGNIGRLTQIQRDHQRGWWTIDHPDSAANIIREVSDNIPPSAGSKYICYQISFNGLEEDAFAYADHQHQWNGLTRSGLPDFLLGADYVQTFNDYRYMNDFQMTIKFSQPAILYLFFDNRVPTPAWLQAGFEDTGVDIGLDEGPWPEGDRAFRPELPEKFNSVGGGNSIDNTFSVWRRRCDDGAPVTLGPVGSSSGARAMYGFAATPLD